VGINGQRLCRPRFTWSDKLIKSPENRSCGSLARTVAFFIGPDETFVTSRSSGNNQINGLFTPQIFTEEQTMTKLKILGAACLSIALMATPALARPGGGGPHGAAHFSGGGARFAGSQFHGGGFRRGFGPGIAAGAIAGAALGSAYYGGYGPGYYGDSYAYDSGYDPGYAYNPGYDNGYSNSPGYNPGYNPSYDNSYATRNGFVCQPGTLFRGEDGRTHLCQ
jgi:hypothetical protein